MDAARPVGQDRAAVDVALLIARVVLGIVFVIHGAQLMFGAFGGPGLAGFVQMMGPVGYLVAIGQFFGGIGLILGVLARFSAAAIAVIMCGAIVLVHAKVGFFMNWMGKQAGEGFEYHLLAIALALVIVIVGPGRLTLVRLLMPRARVALIVE